MINGKRRNRVALKGKELSDKEKEKEEKDRATKGKGRRQHRVKKE